jgi:hypothetical protein
MLKRCGKCGQHKPVTEFYKSAGAKSGLQHRCKVCIKLTARERYARDSEYREKTKAAQKKRTLTYPEKIMRQCARQAGLDPDEVQEKFKAHNGLCDICGNPQRPNLNRRHLRLEMDHDHNAAGVLRGFLCHDCNIGLGRFRDDPARLAGAIRYLEAASTAAAARSSAFPVS